MTISKLKITPDRGAKVHEEGAIKQLRAFFKDHNNGLPELIKNSSDEYVRREVPEAERVVCVLFQNSKGGEPGTVSVLDFGGISSETLETKLSVWADPNASKGAGGAEVQGGKGNGGKAYLAEMFSGGALVDTVRDGKACSYGIEAGNYRFGYAPDASTGKNVPVSDIEGYLDRRLGDIGFSISALPTDARAALANSHGFTLVTGIGPKDVAGRIPVAQWSSNLREHDQMEISLELCKVYVIPSYNQTPSGPLVVPEIIPMKGADLVRTIDLPEQIVDPMSGESVSTTADGALPAGRLELRTSDHSLKRSKKSNIKFRAAAAGYYGYETVHSLGVTSQWRDRIYGTCYVDSAADLALNDRGALADSKLKRALAHWIGEQIQSYAEEFELRDKRESSQKEKNALSRLNEILDEWKNQLLKADVPDDGDDDGDGRGRERRGPKEKLPEGIPARIEVSGIPAEIGVGVSFKPSVQFFDATGTQIRPTTYRWVSSDGSVVIADDDLNVLTSLKAGKTGIHAATYDGKLTSTSLSVEVLQILQIDLDPTDVSVPMGSRRFIKSKVTTTDGRVIDDPLLRWESTSEIVAITTPFGGVVGRALGQASVGAFDDNAESTKDATVTVVKAEGDGGTPRFPRILVSGVDNDPDFNTEVHLLEDQPPVVQRPEDIDRKIWWINASAPLAKMLLDTQGVNTAVWRLYHVDRYIEALTQVFLANGDQLGDELTGELWLQEIGIKASEVQGYAAKTLRQFITTGNDPEESA